MEKKYILVIGASGFIGKNLIEELPSDKYEIIATYTSTNNINTYKATPYKLDLGDARSIRKLLSKHEFDIIFYFSSITNVGKSIKNPILDNINVIHMLTFLEELKRTTYFSETKLVYASSGGTVYGEKEKLPIAESAQLAPLSPYGITKATIENYLKYYCNNYGLNYVVFRYANPYGRYQNPNSGTGVPNIFLYKVLKNEPINIIGDPKEICRDYIYITDLIDITIKIAESHNKEKVYNIGSGQTYSLYEIINVIETVTGKKANIILQNAKKGLVKKVILDISKAKEEFSWKPKISLLDGIKENYNWINEWMKQKCI